MNKTIINSELMIFLGAGASAFLGKPLMGDFVDGLLKTLEDRSPKLKEIAEVIIEDKGKDLEVLKSNNWSKYRPELVIAEHVEFKLENLLESEIHKFMSEINYKIRLWLPPSIIYEKQNI